MIDKIMFFLGLDEDQNPDVTLPYTVTGEYYVRCDPEYKYVYEMRRGRRVIYVGITGNPTARRGTYSGKVAKLSRSHNTGIEKSDRMVLVDYLPVAKARKREVELIAKYGLSNLENKNRGG